MKGTMTTRIVVVDSNADMRELLSFALEPEGLQVLSYAYAQIKLTTLATLYPDLIILNFSPEEEGVGWELLQLLKMGTATARIPILITTNALWLSAEIRNYLLTRYIRVVQMPFDLTTFPALVQRTLAQAKQAGELFISNHPLPVLVVDDTDEIRENITTFLELENYPVASAGDGLAALKAVSEADHSLILLDIHMPIMNGFEFLSAYDRQLRPHTPVIIISSESHFPEQTLPSFVVDVLPKPFLMKALLIRGESYARRL